MESGREGGREGGWVEGRGEDFHKKVPVFPYSRVLILNSTHLGLAELGGGAIINSSER